MPEYADTKARRRRRIRETFPPPLNKIAIRHVDSVQALSELHRNLLTQALQEVGVHRLMDCLEILKHYGERIQDESELITRLEEIQKLPPASSISSFALPQDRSREDATLLASLLIRCYPDMPQSSAEALVSSEVMAAPMAVVATTRHALDDATSDFVIIALYALFEERLQEIGQIISNNPAFIKAIQRSHPDWNTKH